MSKSKKPRLGRGLSSLISVDADPVSVQPPAAAQSQPNQNLPTAPADVSDTPAGDQLVYLAIDQLAANPHQPRDHFDPAALDSLAQSIRQDGLMQPVVVRPTAKPNTYEIVAGERRWRAAQIAELSNIPAIIRELTDQQMAEWALIENLQREDLDAIERAQAFRSLIEQFNLAHDQVADRVGVERPTISNYLRLLDLSDFIQQAIRTKQLTAGHGRALLGLSDLEAREALAQKAIANNWSVRAVEQAVRKLSTTTSPTARKPNRHAHLADLERQVADQLKTKVHIKAGRKKGAGTLAIEFYSLDQFDELLTKLGVTID